MEKPTPPTPPQLQLPQTPAKPRAFFFVYATTLLGLVLVAALTVFIMGTIYPFLIGLAVLAIIAVQYLIWGWWFERIYRSDVKQEHDEKEISNESDFHRVKVAYIRFRFFLAKIAGFVAITFGAITLNAYFFFLGIIAVSLFWVWDRMVSADDAKWASGENREPNGGDKLN